MGFTVCFIRGHAVIKELPPVVPIAPAGSVAVVGGHYRLHLHHPDLKHRVFHSGVRKLIRLGVSKVPCYRLNSAAGLA